MKTVFQDASQVAHIWANQSQLNASNSGHNFYCEGKTIYSYGSHFPIATIIENPKTLRRVCLFTNRTYSNTTSKHIAMARQANHLPLVYMENVPCGYDLTNVFTKKIDSDFHKKNIAAWEYDLKVNFAKLETARKKEIYLDKIAITTGEINKYLEFFGLKAPKILKELLQNANPEKYQAYLQKESKRIKAEQLKKTKLRLAAFAESVTKWRNFETHRLFDRVDYDFLRYNSENNRIETSQQVQIPLEIAKRFYTQIKEVISNGGCDNGKCEGVLGLFMGEFEIKEINANFIHIGCHKILMSEIETIIKTL